MSDTNKRTIAAYNEHIDDYVRGTPHDVSGDILNWIALMLQGVHHNARILELGSGFGRDANYIESLGYTVQRSDASEGFVALLRSNGNDASVLNALSDEISGPYDVIFANAVLLHFTAEETQKVLTKLYAALKPGGTFACTLKRGEGDMWSEHKLGAPRYFKLWQEDGIKQLLTETGFVQLHFDTERDQIGSKWLYIIARKS